MRATVYSQPFLLLVTLALAALCAGSAASGRQLNAHLFEPLLEAVLVRAEGRLRPGLTETAFQAEGKLASKMW